MSTEKTIRFTVDSSLLRELGERLIGKPFIALAELVKNSFDADSTWVRINLDLPNDRIVVGDNGHGMLFDEFRDFWMRVGSVHKAGRFSRKYHRLMTGSKGVGRLAVQFLSNDFRLETTSDQDLKRKLVAEVKWDEAVTAGDLTEATVRYRVLSSATGFPQGTTISLTKLKQDWKREQIEDLAGEIWQLRPPTFGGMAQGSLKSEPGFEIQLFSQDKKIATAFRDRLTAIEDVWHARLVGQNKKGLVNLALQFAGEDPQPHSYGFPGSTLANASFDIRIYKLTGRKPRGIRVSEAREYLAKFGGVRVYDSGFQLPYYGKTENDWLGVEVEHSHRLDASKLLPKNLQVRGGLSFLPTMTRMLGVVSVDTSKEREMKITITRDRLQENDAYEDLRLTVRYALHFYAMEEARRTFAQYEKERGVQAPKFQSLDEVLDHYKDKIASQELPLIRRDIHKVADQLETEAEHAAQTVALMGSLATAGIASLALQHQLRTQFANVEAIITSLGQIQSGNPIVQSEINNLKDSLSIWLSRARATNDLFSFMRDPRNIRDRKRYRARGLVDDVANQLRSLARGIPISSTRIQAELLLPSGSIAEWSAILQNVFTNAFNALIDADVKMIDVSSRSNAFESQIVVQNTGVPIDLDEAEDFFEPFVRKINISPQRQALGYGGTGLGLTIVRMIANNLGCTVGFVIPEEGFNTAFVLKWREKR